MNSQSRDTGLYRPQFEHDGCGFGLIAQMDGQPSHGLVRTAVQSLCNLTHRGAIASDGKSGDGCGIMLRIPDRFMRRCAVEQNISLKRKFAVGMIFLDPDPVIAHTARTQLEQELISKELQPAGWRVVPVNPEALGESALSTQPRIEQILINAPEGLSTARFERRLYAARRATEKKLLNSDSSFYICSMSSLLMVYKGLFMPDNLTAYFLELDDPELESSLAVFHQRFSTNTAPTWRLAQPFRMLAHNGEINTIQSNRNWAIARSGKFADSLHENVRELLPIVDFESSDSASLDNMLDFFVSGGMDIFRAMQILVPPAWQNVDTMDSNLRSFHSYNSLHSEPWDGPAGIVLTDGRYAACVMDRNGLRPARYIITADRYITLCTEIGVHDYSEEDLIAKGRLKPGEMIAADTKTGALLLPDDINEELKNRQPYSRWLKQRQQRVYTRLLNDTHSSTALNPFELAIYRKMFDVSFEEQEQVIRVLSELGLEAVGSMGDDTPLPVLSDRRRSIYDYFRQQFAQVTNPPIDPLREKIVMSLETTIGLSFGLFEENPEHARRLIIGSPVLSGRKFYTIMDEVDPAYSVYHISLNYPRGEGLENAIRRISDEAVEAVRAGDLILTLSDRNVSPDKLPIPAVLATGAVHHRLIDEDLRCDANIIVETATARDPHHFAVLIGYGATAIYPYLSYALVRNIVGKDVPDSHSLSAIRSYRQGIKKGLFKIMSKMGISTVASYRGAQLFEAVGLHDEVVDLCFKGTVSRIQGTNFEDIENDLIEQSDAAWDPRTPVSHGGLLKYSTDSEYHAFNPDVVHAMHAAVESGDTNDYRIFASLVNDRTPMVLRDLLRIKTDGNVPIDLADVEPVESILKRFDSAAMSLGALSPEAHEVLAEAMNEIGGRSNSGEGGEDPKRYGSSRTSKIKQVASGRFGVTPHYLTNAEVLQIKIAQGAKPGEGGQLPGHKVSEMIASLRYSSPGVSLISPPPHHDIYSIEDLAQLIFDLKQVNPEALVSVKLVSEAGVGTIAAGVTKAYADLITIAGYDGGTGASPITSVKYAGSPWELGLVETQQTLRMNGLRHRVRLQVDGGLKTGLDVIKAAMLGADSFGFGTAPMIAIGCKYLRVCHLNNCATGVATQNSSLRERHFKGTKDKVVRYFRFVAEEVRELLASIGVRSLDEVIGRPEYLEMIEPKSNKQKRLDLSALLSLADVADDVSRRCTSVRNEPWDKGPLAEQMVTDALPCIKRGKGDEFDYKIANINRSIGARLSGEIAKSPTPLSSPIKMKFKGIAGQSFGAWNAAGLELYLEGDANDYVGKGMAGGKIVIRPPHNSPLESQLTPIVGNTCLYGATGGRFFAAGTAGERFAVRNSGVIAVLEGCGDHGCEYMTGGAVLSLGRTGVNFGAGMTGGIAFVLDLERIFVDCYNHELIDIHRLTHEDMEPHLSFLHEMIGEYVDETGSRWGKRVRDDFLELVGRFWLIKPKAADIKDLMETLREAA